MRRSILIVVLLSLAAIAATPASAQTPAYEIPSDNPFAGTPGARGEIYVYGMRNPFRWSFDRLTGDMLIGDVGGGLREEIDFLPKGSIAGRNLGWSCREGTLDGPTDCTAPNAVGPSFEYVNGDDYASGEGNAVIGGHVVRDPDLPAWQGRYLFGDIGNAAIRWLGPGATGPATAASLDVSQLSSISEDGVGHLYATSLGGSVSRLTQVSASDLDATPIDDFDAPLQVTGPPGDPNRLFVVEQGGTLRLRVGGQVHEFLTVQTQAGGEQGLLSAAVSPDYASSGKVYVFYVNTAGDLQLDEFRRAAGDPSKADPASRRPVITIPHPEENNHNGGTLQFGQDGYLYLSLGDGGGQGDPGNDAQRLDSLLGKIIRIDPDPTPGPPPPPPNGGDVTAPVLKVRATKRQRVLRNKGVVVFGRCNEACAMTLSARLRIGKRTYTLRGVKRQGTANQRLRLKATLTKRQLKALRKAVEQGKRPKLRLALTAADGASNRQVVRRTVRVRR